METWQLKAAIKGHKRNRHNDILNHVKFEARNGLLHITYTDNNKTIITLNFTTESDDITFLFPIDVLKKLSTTKNTLHEFIVSDNFNSVSHIENGISQTHSTPDHSQFPVNPYENKEFSKVATLDDNTINKLNLATLSTSKSESRPVLRAVLLKDDKIFSTDSHRLFTTQSGITVDRNIILPAHLIEKLQALTGKIDIVELHNSIAANGEFLKLSNMSFSIYYDEFLGNYPDVSRLLPQDFNLIFDILEFDKFKKTLEAIKKLDKHNPVVRFNVNNGQLELSHLVEKIQVKLWLTLTFILTIGEVQKIWYSAAIVHFYWMH